MKRFLLTLSGVALYLTLATLAALGPRALSDASADAAPLVAAAAAAAPGSASSP